MTEWEENRQREQLTEWRRKEKANDEKRKYIINALRHDVQVENYSREYIDNKLWDIVGDIDEVQFVQDVDREIVQDLLGDEAVVEFEMAFVYLSEEAESFRNDYTEAFQYDEEFAEFYDYFVVAAAVGNAPMHIYDGFEDESGMIEYVGDYRELDRFDEDKARKFAESKMSKLTKPKLFEYSRKAFGLLVRWTVINTRYEELSGVMNVVKGSGGVLLAQIREIEEAYEKADKDGWYEWEPSVERFERFLSGLPDTFWVE